MAIADLRDALRIVEPLDNAGVAADDQIDRLAHAQRIDRQRKKRQKFFIMSRRVGKALQRRSVNRMALQRLAQTGWIRHQRVNRCLRKERADLFQHLLPSPHADEPVVGQRHVTVIFHDASSRNTAAVRSAHSSQVKRAACARPRTARLCRAAPSSARARASCAVSSSTLCGSK
jgi:hypothetical protein